MNNQLRVFQCSKDSLKHPGIDGGGRAALQSNTGLSLHSNVYNGNRPGAEVSKPDFPHRLTNACSGWIPPMPTAKRSLTHAKMRPVICHKQWGLDIRARLEKWSFQLLTINLNVPFCVSVPNLCPTSCYLPAFTGVYGYIENEQTP